MDKEFIYALVRTLNAKRRLLQGKRIVLVLHDSYTNNYALTTGQITSAPMQPEIFIGFLNGLLSDI